jgi:hypothetical protein
MSMDWQESDGGSARRAVSRVISSPETSHRSSFIEKDVPISLFEEPHQGLKRRRAEEEPQTELTKQSPAIPPGPPVKRRRIGDKDIEMDVSLADLGTPSRVPETILPTDTSVTAVSLPCPPVISLISLMIIRMFQLPSYRFLKNIPHHPPQSP